MTGVQTCALPIFKKDIEQLAIRHKKYGALPQHYAKVGDALLWTIQNALGTDFIEETNEAWKACYSEIENAMLSAY